MYLHVGGDIVIHERDLISIINLDTSGLSQITKEFLQASAGKIIKTKGEDKHKSCIIAAGGYLSTISSSTLAKRKESFNFSEDLDTNRG